MNYYQFHIADWALHTSHLTLEEEVVYRRLLDHYYDTESPIPEETNPVIRRLRLRGMEVIVSDILTEFFVLESDGWHNRRADREIAAYHQKAEQARSNGKRGGRPKKNNGIGGGDEKPDGNQEKTDPVISGSENEPKPKANQEPRTINQEPKDKSKTLSSEADASDGETTPAVLPKFSDDDYRLADGMAKAILRVAPKTKPPDLRRWAETIRLMRERDGLSHSEIAEIFRFANRDDFWKTNILSPAKLREQFAKLDAKMRNPSHEKRNGTSADRWAIDHEDTSWLTGESGGQGDCLDGEFVVSAAADDLHRLETRG